MDKEKNILFRAYFIFLGLFVFGLFIAYNLFKLNLDKGDYYRDQAEKRIVKNFEILPTRGNIYSDDGSLLATSVSKFSIFFDAVTVKESVFNKYVGQLSDSLDNYFKKPNGYYLNVLKNARLSNNRYKSIARKLSYTQYLRLVDFPMFNLGGIRGGVIVVRDFVRDLPMNKIAERTIGYEKRNPNGTYIKVGLEGAYGKHLRGKPGKQLRQRIANNQWKPLSNNYQQQPIDGLDIWTTISTDIQDITHNSLLDALEKFDADHGSAVVMETKTGKIKAISNLGKTSDNKYYEKLNYAIGRSYEPGSTFKLFSMLVALEDKVIDTSSVIDTEMGELKFFNKYFVRDSKKGGYGKIPISEVFERSSNTGVVKMIYEKYKENPEKFSDRLISIGIDKPLGLSIKGEGKPKIPHPDDNDWDGLDLPWMSFGYGVQLTPIQTLAYYNAIANNGELVMPRFVSSIRKFDGTLFKKFDRKIINPAICSEDTVKKLKIMMQGVVSKPWGTAHNIFDKNIILAGKTGTTQINYATDRVEYVSSFVGYFPANNPKYSCIVVISKPNKAIGYYGNKVAAPVFKKIAKSVINNLPNELKLNIDDINRLSDLMNQPSDNTKVLDKS